VSRFLTIHQHK